MAAKTDMDRVGVFSEMGYLLGDKYKMPGMGGFNVQATKGKQMLPGGSKEKAASKDGYFAEFGRVFEKEAYSDVIRMRRRDRLEKAKKNIGKSWTPSSYPSKPCGAGNNFGTFGGKTDHLVPNARAGKAYSAPLRNFTTNPGKAGTGYGYPNVCIGKDSECPKDEYERSRDLHRKETQVANSKIKGSSFKLNMHPKEFFDENPFRTDKPMPPDRNIAKVKDDSKPFIPSNPGKEPCGGKFGTFDPYPDHSKDKYLNYVPNVFRQSKPGEKVFVPSAYPKTCPVNSVVNQMVELKINETNYNHVEQCY